MTEVNGLLTYVSAMTEVNGLLTCVSAMIAIEFAASLALTGTPAPRANILTPMMKLNVVRP